MLPDLEGTFEPVEAPGDQLDAIRNTHLEATREIITEQELRKTYYKLAFKQVQYGTYRGKPACVLVVEVDLRAPERGRHRFKGVSIEVEFLKSSALDTSVEVLKFAPETVYGRSITLLTLRQGWSGLAEATQSAIAWCGRWKSGAKTVSRIRSRL
jgi:hypothetical protein